MEGLGGFSDWGDGAAGYLGERCVCELVQVSVELPPGGRGR
jgi:hypothetical protein